MRLTADNTRSSSVRSLLITDSTAGLYKVNATHAQFNTGGCFDENEISKSPLHLATHGCNAVEFRRFDSDEWFRFLRSRVFWNSSWLGCIWILLRLPRPLRRQISVHEHFSGAGRVCMDTSPWPKGVFKYTPGFSGAGEVSDKYIYRKFRRSI